MSRPRRCLVTGGAGFIGSRWVRHLLSQGHDVIVLDNFATGRAANIPAGAEVVAGDVRDIATVEPLVRRADTVFHLAAVVGVRQMLNQQLEGISVNVLGAFAVLYPAAKLGKEVVLASSSAIYGKTPRVPIAESDDILLGNTHIPAWTYSTTKILDETLARALVQSANLSVKLVRIFNCIGPGQTGAYGMVVPRFVDAALRGRPLPVYGDGSQTRTFLDVEDAVRGIETVWHQGAPGEAYNLGGGGEVRIDDLARMVIALAESASSISYIPFRETFGDEFEEIRRRVPDLRKIATLGYRPAVTLEQSLTRIIDRKRKELPA